MAEDLWVPVEVENVKIMLQTRPINPKSPVIILQERSAPLVTAFAKEDKEEEQESPHLLRGFHIVLQRSQLASSPILHRVLLQY